MRRPINPAFANIFIDSCAFDPKYSPEDQASADIFRIHKQVPQQLKLTIAHSTQKEVDHPNTPAWVKRTADGILLSIEVGLNDEEQSRKALILSILTGNGNPDNYKQDAEHVFEASKYGPYFITTDDRILRKSRELATVCAAVIVKPSKMLEIIQTFSAANQTLQPPPAKQGSAS